jgi:hypothetical protein
MLEILVTSQACRILLNITQCGQGTHQASYQKTNTWCIVSIGEQNYEHRRSVGLHIPLSCSAKHFVYVLINDAIPCPVSEVAALICGP